MTTRSTSLLIWDFSVPCHCLLKKLVLDSALRSSAVVAPGKAQLYLWPVIRTS